jgi:hypothetical protein
MKLIYDKVSSEYLYPLSKLDIVKLKSVVPLDVISKIRCIRFGCNTKTTQEGRVVQHGNVYDIRVNFCLNNMKTLILSDNKKYIAQINKFGGIVNFDTRCVAWRLNDAKRYALFLLLHEVSHVIFALDYGNKQLAEVASNNEEEWCDNYALNKLQEINKVNS